MGQKRTTNYLQEEAEKKKKTGESSQPAIPQFGDPKHRIHYRQLMDKLFVEG